MGVGRQVYPKVATLGFKIKAVFHTTRKGDKMKKREEIAGEAMAKQALQSKFTPEKIKDHKAYVKFLKARFGETIFKKNRLDQSTCPLSPTHHNFIESDQALVRLQDSYDRAYEVTKDNLGKSVPGFKMLSGHMTRRNYLKTLGLFLASVTVPLATASCSTPCNSFQNEEGQAGSAVPGPTDEATVAIVKGGSSIEDNVRRAVALAGDLDEIKKGETVVIKPNCVSANAVQAAPFADMEDGPIATNPEVIRAVIRIVKERNGAPEKIFVADNGAFMSNTLDTMIQWGVYDVAMEEGVHVMPWNETGNVCYQSDKFQYLDYPVHVSDTLRGFDHFISVPVLKNHELTVYPVAQDQAQYTCCLKLFVGTIIPTDRLTLGRNFHELGLPAKAAELNLSRPYRMLNGKPGVTMNIVDATRVIVSGGPHNNIYNQEMVVEHPGIILASKDRVACDTAALSVLKHYGHNRLGPTKDYIVTPVWDQMAIVHAGFLGLGINDPGRINIVDHGVPSDEMQAILRMWNQTEPMA